MYPRPNLITCTLRVWLREIGFSLTYGALMLKTWRISVIFRVKSAKAIKITDLDLLKRLGMIVTVFTVLLLIRTLVAPPMVIIGRTEDDLKAYLCKTDWWDHSFTTLEVLFLIWGIRLCIVVRKAPSEFNESRFISLAIYNEFIMSLFLNISMYIALVSYLSVETVVPGFMSSTSGERFRCKYTIFWPRLEVYSYRRGWKMVYIPRKRSPEVLGMMPVTTVSTDRLFLQKPANPDLLYIIFFCHTQITITLLLCFIFGSKAYMVFKGNSKSEDTFNSAPKVHITKFLTKPRSGNSQYAASTNSSTAGPEIKLTEQDVLEEFKRLYTQLEMLKDKNMRHGNIHLGAKINAMQEAGRLEPTLEAEEHPDSIDEGEPAPARGRGLGDPTAPRISILFNTEGKSRSTEEVTV